MRTHLRRSAAVLSTAALLVGCAVGPNYRRPVATAGTAAWKSAPGWLPAQPADDRLRVSWWTRFDDPVLNGLEAQVVAANQNIAAALAAVEQAQAVVRENRAALFPTVGVSAGATRNSGGGSTIIGGTGVTGTGSTGTGSVGTGGVGTGTGGTGTGTTVITGVGSTRRTLGATASWAPDLFGRVRRGLEGAHASAAASAADLANVTLVAQADLAIDYVDLRSLDAQAKLYDATVVGYQRALQITQNRYTAGVSARADLVQAQSQLFNAQANAVDLARQRAVYENAIAVLVGRNPSSFAVVAAAWRPVNPAIPAVLPSTLTERRPDIAAAERRVAAANAQIGVQKAGYFPSLSLSAADTLSGGGLGSLFGAAANFWSFGASAAQTLLDFGATRARVAQARAVYAQTVANYRQTALTAFGEVENQLAAVDVLDRETALRRNASTAADQAEAIALNQYKAGLVAFTDVITLQTAALNERLTLVAAIRDRQLATVALAQAIGGDWRELVATAAPAR